MCLGYVTDSPSTDSPSKLDICDISCSSRTHLRFTAGVLSPSPPSLDSTPPCAPEVVLKSPPGGEKRKKNRAVKYGLVILLRKL